jgi:transcriptional regulator with XRE-family HTH domain
MRGAKTAYQLQSPAQFSVYLKSLRRSQGLTQRDLGRRVGVSGARISEIENDPSAVGLTQVLKLLHVLGARAVIEVSEKGPAASRKHSSPAGEW